MSNGVAILIFFLTLLSGNFISSVLCSTTSMYHIHMLSQILEYNILNVDMIPYISLAF